MKKILLLLLLVCATQLNAQCTASPTLNITGAYVDSAKCGNASGGVYGISMANVSGGTMPYNFIWTYTSTGMVVGTSPTLSNVGVGTYSLQVTDANGCVAIVTGGASTFTIAASAPVAASFTTNPNPATGNIPLTLNFTNTSSGATSFAWDFGDGSNTTQVNPAHTYTTAGTYTVSLIATNGSCSNLVRSVIIASAAGGIEKISDNNLQVTIEPNPSNGNFTIEANFTEKKAIVFVFDANGRLVLNQFIASGKTGIDASNLRDGAYSLNLVSNEGTVTKKLVIIK